MSMLSKIPDFLKPLIATSGLLANACHPEIIQLALGFLITERLKST